MFPFFPGPASLFSSALPTLGEEGGVNCNRTVIYYVAFDLRNFSHSVYLRLNVA